MKKVLAVMALFAFLAGFPAYAADWNFYGSARVNTFYTKFEKSPFSSGRAALGLAMGSDTKNYEQGLQGNARIGARVKVNDSLSGRFEYGALRGNVNLRILYGDWNFGAGTLRIGKAYSPLTFPISNQVWSVNSLGRGDHHMSTFGMLYAARKPMVRLKFGGFQIAAVAPENLRVNLPSNLTAIGTQQPDTEIVLPAIQAKYVYTHANGDIQFSGGFQDWKVVDSGQSHDLTSWVLGIGARLNLGRAYFKGNVWGGQNVGNQVEILVNQKLWSTTGNAGTGNFDGDGFGLARWDGSKIIDRDAVAGLIVAGFKIREGLYLEAGYGYTRTELDSSDFDKDDCQGYYIQSTIFLAPGVSITPEIGQIDMKQDDSVITYFGAKWQINF